MIKSEFRRAGVTIVFASQGIISGHPRDKLQEGIYEVINEHRSDELGMMVADACRAKYERGGVNGKPPLGYERYHGEPGDPRNGSLVLEEAGAETVRLIYQRYLTGEVSYTDIAISLNRDLEEHGASRHTTRLGHPFTKGSIEVILQNRTYLGETVWAPGSPEEEVRVGTHPAIIERDAFESVAAIRARRSNGGGRHTQDHVYPLSGPAVCGRCGATYHSDIGGRNRIRRMRHKGDVACEARRMFKAAFLEEQLGTVIADRFALPDNWLAHYEQLLDTPVEMPDQSLAMRRLRQAKTRLDDIYPYSDMTKAEYRRRKGDIDRQLRQLAPPQPKQRLDVARRGADLLHDLGALWSRPATTDEHRKRFVQTVIEEIRLDDHGVAAVRPRDDYAPLVAIAEAGGFWSGWADSNCRPHGPKPRALPG